MPANISSYSLKPFTGKWTDEELLHLLRRSLFGIGHREMHFFKGKTLGECLDILLHQSMQPGASLQEQQTEELVDPLVPVGKTWVNAPFENDEINNARRDMLRVWWAGLILNRDFSLTEKMTLFWHNHFVTELDMVRDSRYSYLYIALLHAQSLGNFKELIRSGSTTPAMLVYLNGNANFKSAPNENYARELMELFTLGKEHGVRYTEDDVKAAARVLTGWRDDKEKITSFFDPSEHDTGDKHFSAFFGNHVIPGREGAGGAAELDDLVDMIFGKKELARYVCRNLYRWFVFTHADDRIEDEVISPLAEIFIQNNFEIAPVLRTLLGSEHFFDPVFRGCMIKSPVDFLFGATLQIGVFIYNAYGYTNLAVCQASWLIFHFYCEDLTMRIGDPPSVAGWPACYQSPEYGLWWTNSALLCTRKKLLDDMCTHEGLVKNGYNASFDCISFAKPFASSGDVGDFVKKSSDFLCAAPPDPSVLNPLKELLTSGMDSRYWKDAWEKLAANPDDNETREVLNVRLRMFFSRLFSLPEYQMM